MVVRLKQISHPLPIVDMHSPHNREQSRELDLNRKRGPGLRICSAITFGCYFRVYSVYLGKTRNYHKSLLAWPVYPPGTVLMGNPHCQGDIYV